MTNTPIPPPITPTSTPDIDPVITPDFLPSLLPANLALSPRQPFQVHEQGAGVLGGVAAGFPNPAEAERFLREWGWQQNAFRVYTSDFPPANATGWVELNLQRFATANGAAQALDYFANAPRTSAGMRPVDLGLFGDQATALAGPAYNGDEVTIYARRGTVLIRATGIAPNGDPTADVIEAILIPLTALIDEPRVVSAGQYEALAVDSRVPPQLSPAELHARSASSIARTFPDVEQAEWLFTIWGWREHAEIVYTAGGSGTAAGTTRLYVNSYQLADAESAATALAYISRARAESQKMAVVPFAIVGDETIAISGTVAGEQEASVFLTSGPYLFRLTATGPGDPMRDLEALLVGN